MTQGSVKIATMIAVIVLTSSCLIFTAPSAQAESAVSLATVEEDVVETEVSTELVLEEPEEVVEAPVENTVSETVTSIPSVVEVRMIPGLGGILIPVFDPVMTEQQSDDTYSEPVSPDKINPGLVTYSKVPESFDEEPVESMRTLAPVVIVKQTQVVRHVVTYDETILHTLFYQMKLAPMEFTDDIVTDRDASDDDVPDDEDVDIEAVPDDESENEHDVIYETFSPVLYEPPAANEHSDVLRAEAVLAGLA